MNSISPNLFFTLCMPLAWPVYAQIPLIEHEALIALHNSTGGADWSNSTVWMGAAGTECDWYGITWLNGSVTELRLSGNSLSGSIPSELGNSTRLAYLYFSNNTLTDSISSKLSLILVRSAYLHGQACYGPYIDITYHLIKIIKIDLCRQQWIEVKPLSSASLVSE